MQHVPTIAGRHQVSIRGLNGEGVAEPQDLNGWMEQITGGLVFEFIIGAFPQPSPECKAILSSVILL